MSITVLILLVLGLALLIVGAEALVRGASRLAAFMGVSPLVIGLTVVAYGTSSPELAVSFLSNFTDKAAISVGNIVGSNICNVLLVLGISAMIAPLIVSQQLIRLDVPLMIGVSVLLLFLALDSELGKLDGALFLLGSIVYTLFLIYQSRRKNVVQDEYEQEYGYHGERSPQQWFLNLGLVGGGFALLVLGSRWLVDGAVTVAQALGVSDLVIGLTVVAIGTSLPEVATAVTASLRGEGDIAVGNVVGSNIFNIVAVLGISAIFAPNGIEVSAAAIRFDIPIMIAVAVACLPIFFTGNVIDRWEGFLFAGYYAVYTAYLILYATDHDVLPIFSTVMLGFVIPITVVTLAIFTWRSIRARREGKLNQE
ncbi:MAG: sodium:calcium antiporter [Cyanobacteria bacterium SW_11_48_12]|nr:MAG: sodium:calcium antiporter [Cyanobacteria bacterium SW_11_48_12]